MDSLIVPEETQIEMKQMDNKNKYIPPAHLIVEEEDNLFDTSHIKKRSKSFERESSGFAFFIFS